MRHGIIDGLSEIDYFSDPALSSTEARWLLESAATYRWRKDHREPSNDAFDFGSAVHTKVLGTGWNVVVLDYPDWRSKDARATRDDVRFSGQIPVLTKDAAIVDAMAESVLAHPTARALFEADGIAEASVFATDPVTGVNMKARFDKLGDIAVDLKTTAAKATAEGFAKSAASYGYQTQQGHYLETLGNVRDDETRMNFVVVEKAAPYLVGVFELDDEFAQIGYEAAKRARELYAECVATGTWPGYPIEVQNVQAPAWLRWQYADEYEEIEIA